MKPTLLEIAESYPDMTINVKLSDLLEAFRSIADEIHDAFEQEATAKRNDKLISREEAMRQLGVCGSTLWRWAKVGYLRPVMHGAKVKYYQSDIDELSERQGGR